MERERTCLSQATSVLPCAETPSLIESDGNQSFDGPCSVVSGPGRRPMGSAIASALKASPSIAVSRTGRRIATPPRKVEKRLGH